MRKYNKLDILIHNAAYFNHGEKHQLSLDHIELTFATNVFGPFLMTTLLLDSLKQSDDPRILHASSNIIKHFFDKKAEIHFDNLQDEYKDSKPYSVYKMYSQSKMALVMLTFKMAEMYKEDGIKVNALQINGAKMSKRTLQKFKPWWRTIAKIQNIFFLPTTYMANNYFQICTSNKYQQVSGKLFNDKLEIMQVSPSENRGFIQSVKQLFGAKYYPIYAHNQAVSDRLWEMCNDLTKQHSEDFTEFISKKV
jgi:NAD(P)-dependent dehydrogenase (short-subunit alcohol dehydrogenase family)